MPIGALYPAVTALAAFGTGMQSTAHNLANVLTNNFKAGRVTYSDLPEQSGVRAEGPTKLNVQGPLVPYGPGLPPLENADPSIPKGFVEGSTTDVATEMVNLIITSRSYQANTKTIRTADEMLGTVINLKV
jgi:flagellar basal-body rod protein FlgC